MHGRIASGKPLDGAVIKYTKRLIFYTHRHFYRGLKRGWPVLLIRKKVDKHFMRVTSDRNALEAQIV